MLKSDNIDGKGYRMLTKGDLVYIVTRVVHLYVLGLGIPSFDTKSTGKSILRDALDEYIEVVMKRHEARKRVENGAVSKLDAIQLHETR
jgi:hypothetical protein